MTHLEMLFELPQIVSCQTSMQTIKANCKDRDVRGS